MKDLQIYLIHYTPLKKRKEFQKKQLNSLNLQNVIIIEKYDKQELSNEDLIKFDQNILKLGIISLFKKQIYAMEMIKFSNFEFNLILEDDAILKKNFTKLLKKAISQLPNDYDMLFIDEGPKLHMKSSDIKSKKLVYKKCTYPTEWGGNGGTRGTGGILISKKCSEKICDYFKEQNNNEINLPLDWWLNVAIRDLKLNIYWMEPTIVIQGSVTGKFKSSY